MTNNELEINFTSDQQKAYDTIIAWSNAPKVLAEDYSYAFSGAAGTGKTTLTKYIIDALSRKFKIAVTAPTHKAKKVIADKTNKRAETVQSLLGLRPNVELADFDPNKPEFAQQGEERIKHYSLIVIDEASMINKDAFELIQEKAYQYGTLILYVGDKYQLPPINEKISKVFMLDNIVTMDQIIRQNDSSPNIKLLDLAREDIANRTDNCYHMLNSIKQDTKGNEGYTVLPKEDFYSKLLDYYYDTEFEYNTDFIKTLCYTNDAVIRINAYLRAKLINSKEAIAKGDRLMGYKTIVKEAAGGYYRDSIVNSEDYIVESVTISTERVLNVDLKVYITKFVDVEVPVFILHRDSYSDFAEEYSSRLYAAKSRQYNGWKKFYSFKNEIVLMENIFDENRRFLCSKDVDYGYAITVHKSQGSTYNNVAIFLNDIKRNRVAQERRKLMYVALSRTANMNLIYNG